MAFWRGRKFEPRLRLQRLAMAGEMGLCSGISLCFPMKISIFNIDSNREADVQMVRHIIFPGEVCSWPAETEQRCISLIQHFGRQMDLHRLAFSRARNEHPVRSRSDSEGIQSLTIQGCDETIRVNPNADSLHENMPIRGQARVKVRAKNAIVLGMDSPQIDAHPGHPANPVREQNHLRFR
jgi:hypothetical protein